MNLLERTASIARTSILRDRTKVRNALRPYYHAALRIAGRRGLVRRINGTDVIRIAPQVRNVSETHEPEFWGAIMQAARPGQTVADVGANVGLYSIALAKRVGPQGHIFAFEPDEVNRSLLVKNIGLNKVQQNVSVVPVAVGSRTQEIGFKQEESSESKIDPRSDHTVHMISLDEYFAGRSIDLLKIDVEGYEKQVIEGASGLLKDQKRKPHVLFIEIHPFAWPESQVVGDLLALLESARYEVRALGDIRPEDINHLGWLVARSTE